MEMVQLATGELEDVKMQQNQKLDQLEKGQETLLQVSEPNLILSPEKGL